ncbi:MAG: phenylalanine--tRNA ligase subunit alpha [Spirochaetaceae bacterium]|nr:MAG: phenylalanine--tRNA ligase subunit alpha [Spirochaetaceae bacterium]
MAAEHSVATLHPLETKVLLGFSAGDIISPESIVERLGFNLGQANQSVSWLSQKGFLTETERTPKISYELTELGADFRDKGLPDERLLNYVVANGPAGLPVVAAAVGLENKDIGSAFGALSKAGVVQMDDEKQVVILKQELPSFCSTIRGMLEKATETGRLDHDAMTPEEQQLIQGISKKRGAAGVPFRIVEREEVLYSLSDSGMQAADELKEQGITGQELGSLTSEMLKQGSWKNARFRSYNVNTPPTRVLLGRRNPYCEYLDWVKDRLTALGFEEFDGPLVETEFWNGDALFMPQFHSARDIHDVYYVKDPTHAKEIPQPYLDNVAKVHENGGDTGSRGWGYSFDHDFTRRLVMRSQGTVLSARQLHKAKVPGKYFGIVRCFRYDQVDATHLSDFYQTEGIVLGEEVNLRNLLGLLEMFATEVAGATDVKYVPGYFPFTEPSVEVHIKHPVLGWFELGGSGIFRPEVTKAQGIDVPVLAWGLGIDRMALMHLGLNDLRELFSGNIENVRLRRGN